MLRVRSASASLGFYRDLLGMTLVDQQPRSDCTMYFLQTLTTPYTLSPGSTAAHTYLWNSAQVTLCLCENTVEETYHPGNAEGDGFGHLAVAVEDVYASSATLEAAGIAFKKKPDEGRMKGLAFVYDPDGYWVEVVKRGPGPEGTPEYTLAQTMLRVKDPQVSLEFYTRALGMTLVRAKHFESFSLYFLVSTLVEGVPVPDPEAEDQAKAYVADHINANSIPVLELTHNHGTETQPNFKYRTGDEQGCRGFGHVGFVVEDVDQTLAAMTGVGIKNQTKGYTMVADPDGYSVVISALGNTDF